MRAKSIVIHLLALLLAAPPAMARQRPESPDVWRAFAEKLEVGTFVSVRLQNGTKIRGHLIQVAGDTLLIKPKTRIPLPLRDVRFAEVESIERQKPGLTPGVKVLIGVGTGAGVILGWLLLVFATVYD